MSVDLAVFGDYVKPVAIRVGQRYRGYVEVADLRQELALWVLSHPRRAAEYLLEAEEGDGRRLTRSLYNAAESYARACKASAEGYSPGDEYFYSLRQLRELLPDAMLDTEMWVLAEMRPGERRATLASEGNTRLAMLVDVAAAMVDLSKMDPDRYSLLVTKYVDGWTDDMLAQSMQCTPDAARMRVRRALQMVQTILGGAKPLVDPPEVTYVASRHALSNAAAQAATRGAYSDGEE